LKIGLFVGYAATRRHALREKSFFQRLGQSQGAAKQAQPRHSQRLFTPLPPDDFCSRSTIKMIGFFLVFLIVPALAVVKLNTGINQFTQNVECEGTKCLYLV
jgi:hypothetical protein